MPWNERDFDPYSLPHISFIVPPNLNKNNVRDFLTRLQTVLEDRAIAFFKDKNAKELFRKRFHIITETELKKYYPHFDEDYDGSFFSFLHLAMNASPCENMLILTGEYNFSNIELESLWKYALSTMATHWATYNKLMLATMGKDIEKPLIFLFNKNNLSQWFYSNFNAISLLTKDMLPLAKKKSLLTGWKYRSYSGVDKKICKSFKFKYIKTDQENILNYLFLIEHMILKDNGEIIWNGTPFREDHQKALLD
jgi:hypothetical protein